MLQDETTDRPETSGDAATAGHMSFGLAVTPLPESARRYNPVRLEATEEIGRPYEVILDLVGSPGSPDLRAKDFLGRPLQVTYTWKSADSGGTRRWSGIVMRFAYMGKVGPNARPWFRVTLVPQLALSGLGRRSRVLAKGEGGVYTTPKDLLAYVLKRLGVDADLGHVQNDAALACPPQEFFIQFEESDLAFVSRIAETYGISYFWKPATAEAASSLVFTDNNFGFGTCLSDPITVDGNIGTSSHSRGLSRLEMHYGLLPSLARAVAWQPPTAPGKGVDGVVRTGQFAHRNSAALQEFGYKSATDSTVDVTAPLPTDGICGWNEPVVSPDPSWDSANKAMDWANHLAKMRLAEEAMQAIRLRACSNLDEFFAGGIFTLPANRLPTLPADTDADFLVTAIRHLVRVQGADLVDGGAKPGSRGAYENWFEAVATRLGTARNLDYRPPRRTPVPAPAILRTGTLVARQDTPATKPNLDAEGRYLVLPDIAVEKIEDNPRPNSPPTALTGIRMPLLAAYGGAPVGSPAVATGMHLPLHPKQTVLVSFAAGLERPFIAGLLPDKYQPSPVNADTWSQGIIRSASGITVRITDNV